MLQLTERDRRLLIGLVCFCLVSGVVFLCILPLRAANQEWEMQITSYEDQMDVLRQKSGQLPMLQEEYENEKVRMKERQDKFLPFLEDDELDGLVTGQIREAGVRILQLKMGAVEEEPEILTRTVDLKLWGTREQLEGLIGAWCLGMPGIRMTGFRWETDRTDPDMEILFVQLKLHMLSAKEERE